MASLWSNMDQVPSAWHVVLQWLVSGQTWTKCSQLGMSLVKHGPSALSFVCCFTELSVACLWSKMDQVPSAWHVVSQSSQWLVSGQTWPEFPQLGQVFQSYCHVNRTNGTSNLCASSQEIPWPLKITEEGEIFSSGLGNNIASISPITQYGRETLVHTGNHCIAATLPVFPPSHHNKKSRLHRGCLLSLGEASTNSCGAQSSRITRKD